MLANLASVSSLFALAFLASSTNAQTAGPAASYIYTYAGQSAAPSLLAAISAAGAPANALLTAVGANTATAVVAPLATVATVGPASVPGLTSNFQYSSAVNGEIFPTATRAAYTAIGTIDTSVAGSTPTVARASSADRLALGGAAVVAAFVGAALGL